jgi:hypothetical protein
MKILNFGSLNIDLVYRVPHIVKPGETLSSLSLATFAGGKGNNQSIALARAGAPVYHAGRIGKDGEWLVGILKAAGADVRFVRRDSGPTGHAVIQVADGGRYFYRLLCRVIHQGPLSRAMSCLCLQGRGDIGYPKRRRGFDSRKRGSVFGVTTTTDDEASPPHRGPFSSP